MQNGTEVPFWLENLIWLLEDIGLEIKHGPLNPDAWQANYWIRVKLLEPKGKQLYEHYEFYY